MGRLPNKVDYENLRKSRILENQARLASLGLRKTLSDLRSLTSSTKLKKTQKKKWTRKPYDITALRRSDRIKQINTNQSVEKITSLRRSSRFQSKPTSVNEDESEDDGESGGEMNEEEDNRPANAPFVKVKKGVEIKMSPEMSARRCNSKGRGSVHDPIFGICCHFCRQKKLCGEEDCKRCGDLDPDQPCKGKTDCSVCHSANGVYCRACLKVRYGEELEEVKENDEWMCPHCIEDKGTKPYWICNSSLCLKKRQLAPTGIAIYRAREMGYKSVAHLLMDELQKRRKLGH